MEWNWEWITDCCCCYHARWIYKMRCYPRVRFLCGKAQKTTQWFKKSYIQFHTKLCDFKMRCTQTRCFFHCTYFDNSAILDTKILCEFNFLFRRRAFYWGFDLLPGNSWAAAKTQKQKNKKQLWFEARKSLMNV